MANKKSKIEYPFLTDREGSKYTMGYMSFDVATYMLSLLIEGIQKFAQGAFLHGMENTDMAGGIVSVLSMGLDKKADEAMNIVAELIGMPTEVVKDGDRFSLAEQLDGVRKLSEHPDVIEALERMARPQKKASSDAIMSIFGLLGKNETNSKVNPIISDSNKTG